MWQNHISNYTLLLIILGTHYFIRCSTVLWFSLLIKQIYHQIGSFNPLSIHQNDCDFMLVLTNKNTLKKNIYIYIYILKKKNHISYRKNRNKSRYKTESMLGSLVMYTGCSLRFIKQNYFFNKTCPNLYNISLLSVLLSLLHIQTWRMLMISWMVLKLMEGK